MNTNGTAEVLSKSEIELIISQALRILAEVGVRLPNLRMISILADHGARIDRDQQMAFFPSTLIERFFAETERVNLEEPPALAFTAGAYPQYFHDPETGRVQPHTLETVIHMTRLADALDDITIVYDGMGVPSDIPEILAPLYMRLVVWKYTRKGGCGQVHLTALLPYVLEMSEVMAEHQGGSLADFAFLTIQMISPLRFGQEELEQFMFFWERGLKVEPGQILSAGGTAPVTLAGALSLQLAECLVINLIKRFFYNSYKLEFSNSTTVLDMKNAVFQYGRPELALTHLAMGQLARYFGAEFVANSFLGDAKVPSCELGMQKALTAIPAILAGTRSLGTLGLLSVDEVGSPTQLIIDHEFAGALKRFARGFEVNEDTLAFDLIRQVGPGGLFTGTVHTARHYRKEHWQPSLFSREMYRTWAESGALSDSQRAASRYKTILASHHATYISEKTETALRRVIQKAQDHLI